MKICGTFVRCWFLIYLWFLMKYQKEDEDNTLTRTAPFLDSACSHELFRHTDGAEDVLTATLYCPNDQPGAVQAPYPGGVSWSKLRGE